MRESRTAVLTIAGLDPSAGAGLFADIKTFEQTGVTGFGVSTALTWQNDIDFIGVSWLDENDISKQFDALAARFFFRIVKIGLVPDLERLYAIVKMLKKHNPDIAIIWDPIMKASAGFSFHNTINTPLLQKVLSELLLVTPNYEEVNWLAEGTDISASALKLSAFCAVLLKAGHGTDEGATDLLFKDGTEIHRYPSMRIRNAAKHGSGCVLSAAITAFLAKGYSIEESCALAKKYIEEYLVSTTDLLGIHKGIEVEETADEWV